MGHTKKTHEEFYRLPQHIYQTSKVAKLLLIIEKGAAVEYQGKTLDKIDILLENWNEKDTKTNDVLDKDDEELNVTINLRNSDSESNRGEDELSTATEVDSNILPALSVTTENNETEDRKKKRKNKKQPKTNVRAMDFQPSTSRHRHVPLTEEQLIFYAENSDDDEEFLKEMCSDSEDDDQVEKEDGENDEISAEEYEELNTMKELWIMLSTVIPK
ncbi:hypothetical protein RN001_003616 [Aquatica leii]|uniref:Uncharacterized protein n=1 Tax=Aquatica leii TaxID=1421715 RepID=A0AAN7QBU3_9COLE|nr:hypothetical protein RN001_003616 [Aquatica leii]